MWRYNIFWSGQRWLYLAVVIDLFALVRQRQGCHYTSKQFHRLLCRYQITQSISRRGNCWDNAQWGDFLKVLKQNGCQLAITH